jgi:hypothetical protein
MGGIMMKGIGPGMARMMRIRRMRECREGRSGRGKGVVGGTIDMAAVVMEDWVDISMKNGRILAETGSCTKGEER